jgi:uncharacterized protein with PQ loop repeat
MMPPPWPDYLVTTTAVPNYCEPSSALLASLSSFFHVCIPSPLALISSTLGILSIVSWLFSQLPQIFKNYELQSASSLSPYFLVEWCLGDSTNLIGAIFARQAGWQITVASYYVFVDVVLVFQYYWYTYFKSPRGSNDKGGMSTDGPGNGGIFDGISPFGGVSDPDHDPSSESKDTKTGQGPSPDPALGNSPSLSTEKLSSSGRTIRVSKGNSSASSLAVSPKAVLFTSMLCAVLANASSTHIPDESEGIFWNSEDSLAEIAGRISSWASAVLYLGSRIPQLYKNYKRKSTSGLSPLLFGAAFCGNLFYSTSLLTNPNAWSDFPSHGGGGWADDSGNDRLEWIGRAIPFFLGAFGVLSLDGAMGVQFLIYGDGDGGETAPSQHNKPGKGTWGKISGWMRGWIPSISRKTKSTTEESQSLLREENDSYGAV